VSTIVRKSARNWYEVGAKLQKHVEVQTNLGETFLLDKNKCSLAEQDESCACLTREHSSSLKRKHFVLLRKNTFLYAPRRKWLFSFSQKYLHLLNRKTAPPVQQEDISCSARERVLLLDNAIHSSKEH
jgi:hypothetical protein